MDAIIKDSFFDEPEKTAFWNITDFPVKEKVLEMQDIMYIE